ncbi:hypothetical protein GF345_05530 [Candidatus Woesearchaeota archaeon]|nr:hypothetical protein [Candidatus Woesearchaeota archaeon]
MSKKIIALALIVVLIANLILFSAGIIKGLAFWTIIIITALIAFFGFKKEQN